MRAHPEGGQDPLDEKLRRELAAFADGLLPDARRRALEARLAASPELRARLEEQRAAIAAVTSDDPAPARLRRRIDVARVRRRQRTRRLALLPAAAVSAGLVLLLVLVLPGGGSERPSVAEAAALSARPATDPPPARYDGSMALLNLEVQGLHYPNWQRRFGWKATGARADQIGGRGTRTVFYQRRGRHIGYTIVSGPALPSPQRARGVTRAGTLLHTFNVHGRTVVTWRRKGHTCVLAGAGTRAADLLALGAWRAGGAVPY